MEVEFADDDPNREFSLGNPDDKAGGVRFKTRVVDARTILALSQVVHVCHGFDGKSKPRPIRVEAGGLCPVCSTEIGPIK